MVRGTVRRRGAHVLGQLEAALPLAHKALAAAVPVLILLPLILQRTAIAHRCQSSHIRRDTVDGTAPIHSDAAVALLQRDLCLGWTAWECALDRQGLTI